MTISSSGILDGQKSTDTIINDSSRQTARSFSASAGSGASLADSMRSRGVLERLDELRVEVNNLKLLSGQRSKDGSLSYGGTSHMDRDEFFTPLREPISERGPQDGGQSGGAEESGSGRSRRSISFAPDWTPSSREDGKTPVAGMRSIAGARGVTEPGHAPSGRIGSGETDDFMTLEPAQVEQSWVGKISSAGDSKDHSGHRTDEAMPSGEAVSVRAEKAGLALKERAGGASKSNGEATDVSPSEITEAERRFREEMLAEAELVDLSTDPLDANGFVARRPLSVASAPAPDTALSDAEP
jgi:hypothetical protein